MMQIEQLAPNQVFVFGSNTQGRHGKGAALKAKEFGAQYGNCMGPQGQTYAIITKELRRGWPPITLEFIEKQLEVFVLWAERHLQTEFLLLPIGTQLAGFTIEQLESVLPPMPHNVVLTWRETDANNQDS